MQITREALTNRLNFLMFISTLGNEEYSDTMFNLEISDDEDEDGDTYQDFVIHFALADQLDDDQLFYGDSSEYDDYEELINDIGYVFRKTHFDDSFIEFNTFETYRDSYYKFNALTDMVSKLSSRSACLKLIGDLANNATKSELVEAVWCRGEADPIDVFTALDALSEAAPNQFVKTLAAVIRNDYNDLELTPRLSLTSVHSQDNVKVSDLIYSERNHLDSALTLVKKIMQPMPMLLQMDILYSFCMKLPKYATRKLIDTFEISDTTIVMFVHDSVLDKELLERFGDDWEQKYYDMMDDSSPDDPAIQTSETRLLS